MALLKSILTGLAASIKRLLGRLRGMGPSRLPNGYSEFTAFYQRVITNYQLPDNESFKHAVAVAVMQLSPTTDKAPDSYFASVIRKAMANQVAYSVIEEIRANEKAAQQKAKKEPIDVTPAASAS